MFYNLIFYVPLISIPVSKHPEQEKSIAQGSYLQSLHPQEMHYIPQPGSN